MRAGWWVWLVVVAAGTGLGQPLDPLLVPRLEFRGQVVGPDGVPRGGVEVLLAEQSYGEAMDLGMPAVSFTSLTADAQGRFSYTPTNDSQVIGAMVWSEEGVGLGGWERDMVDEPMAEVLVEGPRLPEILVPVVPWTSASGLVTDSDGQPIAGATVTVTMFNTVAVLGMVLFHGEEVDDDLDLEALVAHGVGEPVPWPAQWSALTTTTGADGRWRLERTPAQGVLCAVTLPGWVPNMTGVFPGSTEAFDAPHLERQAGLRGRLVDPAGQPMAGHRLSTSMYGEATGDPIVTDAEGRFELRELAPPTVDLQSLADGDALLSRQEFELTPGETVDVGDVLAQPARRLTIVFRDAETGRPVEGIGVTGQVNGMALPRENPPRSGPDGTVTVRGPATARYGASAVVTPVLPAGWLMPIEDDSLYLDLEEGVDEPIEVSVYPAYSAAGRVVDETGAPQAGVYVELEHSAEQRGIAVRTDAEGRFRHDAVTHEGSYELTVYEALGATPEGEVYWFNSYERLNRTVPAAELPATGWELVVPTVRRIDVRGRVVDDAGQPVGGARVTLTGAQQERRSPAERELVAGADGTFEVGGLPAEAQYAAAASAPGYLAGEPRALAPGETTFADLRLAALDQVVTGRVLDAAGAPVAGARVYVTSPLLVGGTSDGTGAFSLADLPRGPVTLLASDEQRAVASVAATAGGPPLTITLQPLPPPDPERGREVASELLHDVWEATTAEEWPSRTDVLVALAPLEPVSALQMVAFQPVGERAASLVALWPVVAFEAPLVALEAVDLVEALGPERAARARLLLAVGLLEAGHQAQAETLARATPVAADAPAASRALAALVGARLGQAGAAERWAAAAADLQPEGPAAWSPRSISAALASLVGESVPLDALPAPDGQPSEWVRNRLAGLIGTQPERAAERLAAGEELDPPGVSSSSADGLARTLLRALPAAARLPWVDRLSAELAEDLRPAAVLLNGDPAQIAALADQTLPWAVLPMAAQIAPEVIATTLHKERYRYGAEELDPYLRPARGWLRTLLRLQGLAALEELPPGYEPQLEEIPKLADYDLDAALAVLAEAAPSLGKYGTTVVLAQRLARDPLDRAWAEWTSLATNLAQVRGALLAAEEERPEMP